MARFLNREMDWAAAVESRPLTDDLQEHLGRVYRTLALCTFASVAGTQYALSTALLSSALASLLAFALLIAFVITPYNPLGANTLKLVLLTAFSFTEGIAVAPLVGMVLDLQDGKQILALAAISTLAVFTAMSLVALFSRERSYLYLGGMLATGLNVLLFSSFANYFFRSPLFFNVELYFGLILFVGYVVFDTQLIIEKAKCGDEDYFSHALELFLDLLNIFVRLLIFFAKDKKGKKKD